MFQTCIFLVINSYCTCLQKHITFRLPQKCIMNVKRSFLAVLAMAVLACVGAYVPPGYPRGYYRQRQMEMEDIAQQLQTGLQDNKVRNL